MATLAPLAGFAFAFGGLAPSTAVAAPSFTLIGFPPPTSGGGSSRLYALSADGRSAAGYITGTGGEPGTHWTAEGGRNDFGRTLSVLSTFGFGISGDGRTVVGAAATQTTRHAFRWSEAGGYQDIGSLPNYSVSEAFDANYDGSIIVGFASNGTGTGAQAFRWTAAGGMQGLGIGTRVSAISYDGTTIVGGLGSAPNGFRWTQDSGLQLLPAIDGSSIASLLGVNFNGSIIVGTSGVVSKPTLWLNGVPTDLSVGSSGSLYFSPFSVSDTGSVVTGLVQSTSNGQSWAGVWTASNGIMRLEDYLSLYDVVVPDNVELDMCTAVSSDGLTFAGYTTLGPDRVQGFVATILPPCPADLDNDGSFANGPTRDHAVTIDDLLYFLTGFESGSTLIDLDNGSNTGTRDHAVTIDDLLFFLAHFEAGC